VDVINDEDQRLEDLIDDLGDEVVRRETTLVRSSSEMSGDHIVANTNANPNDFTEVMAEDTVVSEDAIRKALIDFFWIVDNYCEFRTSQNNWKERVVNFFVDRPFKASVIAKIKDIVFGTEIPVPKTNGKRFENQLAN
jgi:hypothetical protein